MKTKIEKTKNYTTFYTVNFGENLCQCDGIIMLNIGDRFVSNSIFYEITWKLFNANDMIMVYHGRII